MRHDESNLTRGTHQTPVVREHLVGLDTKDACEVNRIQRPKALRGESGSATQNRAGHLDEVTPFEQPSDLFLDIGLRPRDLRRPGHLDDRKPTRHQSWQRIAEMIGEVAALRLAKN